MTTNEEIQGKVVSAFIEALHKNGMWEDVNEKMITACVINFDMKPAMIPSSGLDMHQRKEKGSFVLKIELCGDYRKGE